MVLHLAQRDSAAHDSSAAQINAPGPVSPTRPVLCLMATPTLPPTLVPPWCWAPRLMPAAGGGQGDPLLSQDW